MIDFMVKPQEVLLTIDESGEVEEEVVENTEMRELFETMRETLIFLTNQNPHEAEDIFQHRLEKLKNEKQFFSYDRLNKLCWALGSISGCLHKQEEERFVIQVIKELLNLCEKTEGKGNKAQVATDIMYVTS
jgi:exportin-1